MKAERTASLEQGLVRLDLHGKLPVWSSGKGLDNRSRSSASSLPGVGLDCLRRGGERTVVREQII